MSDSDSKKNAKLLALVEERTALVYQKTQLNDQIQAIEKKIKADCHHPMLIEQDDYSSAGYDYRSTITTWDECTICGAKFNEKTTQGSFG